MSLEGERMKLIIDINEEVYSDTIHDSEYDTLQLGITLKEIIKNGTPLEEHGRLGDLDALKKEMQSYLDDCAKTSEYTRLGFETAIAVVEDADTIIEADKENEE